MAYSELTDDSGSAVHALGSIERFVVQPDHSFATGGLSSVGCWLGCEGVITMLHSDNSHNVFIQIHGTKRFSLVSPSAINASFPHTHAFHVHPTPQQVQTAVSSHATNVTLSPGDILYLPPLVLHQVQALEPSISINVFSKSEIDRASSAISSTPLPLDEEWGLTKGLLETAALRYLEHLLQGHGGVVLWFTTRWQLAASEKEEGFEALQEKWAVLFDAVQGMLQSTDERFRARSHEVLTMLRQSVSKFEQQQHLLWSYADEVATYACGASDVSGALHAWAKR